MRCIDAHAHLLHDHQGFHEFADSGVFDEIWLMDLNGMDLSGAVIATSDEVLTAAKAHPGVVFAFGHLDFRCPVDEIDRLKERGFIGLKPYKPATHWNDERYYPFYARAEELDMPILFHTGMAVRVGNYAVRRGGPYGYGPSGMRPSYLAGIGEAFPKLRIIGGHLGYPWFEETVQNLYYCRNIVHDVSGYRHYDLLHELFRSLDRAANEGSGRMLYEKLFFATDQFYGSEAAQQWAVKLKEFWMLHFELVGSVYHRWGRPDEAEKFFYGNAHSFRLGAAPR
ncbi:MAG: amidohydrolase family protein [Lentisphaeria bacterium]|nr:amidohydrolase family protein [Lentisphaeria bacterium]